MYYIQEKLKKHHKDDEWLVTVRNPSSMIKELWIYLEGVDWIHDVYLNFDVPYRIAEIDFVKKQIDRLEKELHTHADPLQIKSGMTIDVIALYFGRSKKQIYKMLKPYRETHPQWFINSSPPIISSEGICYLEQNVFLDKYIEDLYLYKRLLQRKKMKNNEKER